MLGPFSPFCYWAGAPCVGPNLVYVHDRNALVNPCWYRGFDESGLTTMHGCRTNLWAICSTNWCHQILFSRWCMVYTVQVYIGKMRIDSRWSSFCDSKVVWPLIRSHVPSCDMNNSTFHCTPGCRGVNCQAFKTDPLISRSGCPQFSAGNSCSQCRMRIRTDRCGVNMRRC